MRAVDIIAKKRDKLPLSQDELDFIVQGFTKKYIADYQMSAFLMACYLNGLSDDETFWLTEAMVNSGGIMDFSWLGRKIVDKHSSGGVGDKATLVLVPLVASAGLPVFKMSGRGLGHTGGTLDKLESIPGFSVIFSQDKAKKFIQKVGAVIVSASKDVAPADKEIYALRDVTGTVDSLPLIASSIMSKKIAGGADGIVLDVKVGSGAFIKDVSKAEKLARLMVDIGKHFNREMIALITDMNQPLGHMVGNNLEVEESIQCLAGNGPEDLKELCVQLGAHMLVMGKVAAGLAEAKKILNDNLQNGKALSKFAQIIKAQGGNAEVCNDLTLLPKAKNKKEIRINDEGYVAEIDTEKIGIAACLLSVGRLRKEDTIDHTAGIHINKKIGDKNTKGNNLVATLHWSNETANTKEAENLIKSAYQISDKPPKPPKLIHKVFN